MKLIPFVLLLFLLTPLTLGLSTTTQQCLNTTTLQVNTTIDSPASTTLQIIPCQNTCSDNICQDSTQQIDYAWIFLAVSALLIGITIFLMWKLKDTFFVSIAFFFSLLIVTLVALTLGGIGNSIGETTGLVIINVGFSVGLVFVLVLAIFMWQWAKSHYKEEDL